MDTFGNFKDYGAKIVNKIDGYPVRSGEQSLRFEIRAGDCYKNKSATGSPIQSVRNNKRDGLCLGTWNIS